ncbi:MAG TPA: response regulator [Gemmatimonadales bacterium]
MIAIADARGLASDTAALARALDGVPVAIALFDRDLRLVRCNERFRVLTGCPGGMPSLLALHEIFPTSLVAIGPALTAALRGDPQPPLPVRFVRSGAGAGTTAEVSVARLPDAMEREGGTEDGLLFVAAELGRWTATDAEVARPVSRSADAPADASADAPADGRGTGSVFPRGARREVSLPPSVRTPSVAGGRSLAREVRHELANVLNLIGSAAHLTALRAEDPEAVRAYAGRIAGAVERATEILAGAEASTTVTRPSTPSRGPTAAGGREVLVVEDDESSRDLMTAILESRGHRVRAVPGVASALEVLETHAPGAGGEPAIEVMITDVGLDDGNGWELAATARARWPLLRVGVVTGWDAATDPGVVTHFVLRKPLRLPELLACVAGMEP